MCKGQIQHTRINIWASAEGSASHLVLAHSLLYMYHYTSTTTQILPPFIFRQFAGGQHVLALHIIHRWTKPSSLLCSQSKSLVAAQPGWHCSPWHTNWPCALLFCDSLVSLDEFAWVFYASNELPVAMPQLPGCVYPSAIFCWFIHSHTALWLPFRNRYRRPVSHFSSSSPSNGICGALASANLALATSLTLNLVMQWVRGLCNAAFHSFCPLWNLEELSVKEGVFLVIIWEPVVR